MKRHPAQRTSVSRYHCRHAVFLFFFFLQTVRCVNKYTTPWCHKVNVYKHVYVCFRRLEVIPRKDEESGEERQKENRSASLCSAATTGCVQVFLCVCRCPSCTGATKWSELIPHREHWCARKQRTLEELTEMLKT